MLNKPSAGLPVGPTACLYIVFDVLLIMNSKWELLYYVKQDDTKPVEEYIDNLSPGEQAKTLAFIDNLKEQGPDSSDFFCFKNIIVLTNAFEKHTDKVPKSEIKTAKKNRDDFLDRYTEQEIRGLL